MGSEFKSFATARYEFKHGRTTRSIVPVALETRVALTSKRHAVTRANHPNIVTFDTEMALGDPSDPGS